MQHYEFTIRGEAELAEYERQAVRGQLIAEALGGAPRRPGFKSRFRTWFELTGRPAGMPYADIPFRRLQHR